MSKPATKYTPDVLAYVQEHYGNDMTMQQIADHFGFPLPAFDQQVQKWRRKGHKIYSQTVADQNEIRVKSDGKQHIKIGTKWVGLHIHKWEQLHGPIPKGYVLRPAGGDWSITEPDHFTMVLRRDMYLQNVKAAKESRPKVVKQKPIRPVKPPKQKIVKPREEKPVKVPKPKQVKAKRERNPVIRKEIKPARPQFETKVFDPSTHTWVRINSKTWVARKKTA